MKSPMSQLKGFALAAVGLGLLVAEAPVSAQPRVTGILPAKGPLGAAVTISGTNFSSLIAGNVVYFGAVKAQVTSASVTQLVVNVPVGAAYAPVSVTVAGLSGASAQSFDVTFPGGGN